MTAPNFAIHDASRSSSVGVLAPSVNLPRFSRFWAASIQFLADFLAIVIVLWIALSLLSPSGFRPRLFPAVHPAAVIVTAALGVALIFRYTGMHEQTITPLNIRKTELLLRGAVFSLLILAVTIFYAGWTARRGAACGILAIALLLFQRYAGTFLICSLLRRRPRARHPSHGVEVDSQPVLAPSIYPGRMVQHKSDACNSSDLATTSEGHDPSSDVTLSCHGGVADTNNGIASDPPIDERLPTASGGVHAVIKRLADLTLCAPGLIILVPVFIVTAIAISSLDSGGSAFFRQLRIGKHGKIFRLWKFRSMRTDAPAYERSPLSDADPRLTRVGE